MIDTTPSALVKLKTQLQAAWELPPPLSPAQHADVCHLLEIFLHHLEAGTLCSVAPPGSEDDPDTVTNPQAWRIYPWIRQSILLLFRTLPTQQLSPSTQQWWDKIPLRCFSQAFIMEQKIRILMGAHLRRGTYVGPSAVILPSFVNIGAHIGQGTMIDSGVTVGSCAYVGNYCHVAAQVTLGGVLEPPKSFSTILEDHVFLGAGCQVSEGMHLGQGCVVASGTVLTQSTRIVHRETQEVTYGYIPPYSVVVPGSRRISDSLSTQCAIIMKTVDAQTREKTALHMLLRE